MRSPSPWTWVPTLYFAEGFPYALVVTVSVVVYKDLGLSNAATALYTGWLYLPWVIKPLWSPWVNLTKTRRRWIWSMQLLAGAGLGAIALTLSTPACVKWSLALFSILAFASATHDIAADGFYMLGLEEGQQSLFSGIRNTCFRVALIFGQGGLVMLAGRVRVRTGNGVAGWQVAFGLAAALLVGLGCYHRLLLPRPGGDRASAGVSGRVFWQSFWETFAAFFRKRDIVVMLFFLLFYRFGEAQLVKMVQPFLLDPRSQGGLGLTEAQVGFVYGVVGVAALLLGGIAGGYLVSRHGLKVWLWPMVLVLHVPDLVFIYLSRSQPQDLAIIGTCVGLEQFGYGFGFTAYMLYMLRMAGGKHQTAHYAICAGFMALGMMVPGMWSGQLQEWLGYPRFFLWILLATIPGFIVTALIPLERDFGMTRRGAGV